MSAHTPGPWYSESPTFTHVRAKELEYESIKGVTARPAVAQLLKYVPREQRVANALLIAAAPDLYEALRKVVRWLEECAPEPMDEVTRGFVRDGNAALAKAEGREP